MNIESLRVYNIPDHVVSHYKPLDYGLGLILMYCLYQVEVEHIEVRVTQHRKTLGIMCPVR